MLEYSIEARRIDAHRSLTTTKQAEITLDTDVSGRLDAFNPAELFLAACMIKGVERVTPMLKFDLRGVEVKLHGVRQDSPPKMISIDYEIIVDTDEEDRRLDLLHTNVRKFGKRALETYVRIQVPQPISLLNSNKLASCRQRREYPHAAPPQGAFGDVELSAARSRFLLLPAACPRSSSSSPRSVRDIPVLKDQRAKNSQSAGRAPVHCHGEAVPDAGRRRR